MSTYYRWGATIIIYKIGPRCYTWDHMGAQWNKEYTEAESADRPTSTLEIALLYPQVTGEPESSTEAQTSTEIDDHG